jgi:hypothetical protein
MLPADVIVAGVLGMVSTGTMELHGRQLVLVHYIDAQEATASPKERARSYRERRQAHARRLKPPASVTKRDGVDPAQSDRSPVTKRDAPAARTQPGPRPVTKRDASVASDGLGVTIRDESSRSTVQSSAVQTVQTPNPRTSPSTTTTTKGVTKRDDESSRPRVVVVGGVDVEELSDAVWKGIVELRAQRSFPTSDGLGVVAWPAPAEGVRPDGWSGWIEHRVDDIGLQHLVQRLLESYARFLRDRDFKPHWATRVWMSPKVYRSRIPPPSEEAAS